MAHLTTKYLTTCKLYVILHRKTTCVLHVNEVKTMDIDTIDALNWIARRMEDGTEALLCIRDAMDQTDQDPKRCARALSALCTYQEGLSEELRRLIKPA